MLKLKLQYFGHLMWRVDSLEDSDVGRDWGQEKKGMTEDEMAGWHHCLDGRESEWTLGVGDRQGGLACCDSWGCKESDTTEQLKWTELISLHGSKSIINCNWKISPFWFLCMQCSRAMITNFWRWCRCLWKSLFLKFFKNNKFQASPKLQGGLLRIPG